MNKKGFTLIELLAVVAILAILAIIALPNVLELYKNTRKNAFLTEVQSVYEAAKTKYFLNQFGDTGGNKVYTSLSGITGAETLQISGGTGGNNFKYCVVLDASGKATKFQVRNGTFYYNGTNITKASEIVIGSVTEATTDITACAAS